MATWVRHLIIADRVMERIPDLCRHEFCVGNIAPDCNVENEDWTSFTPPRELTHWMTSERKSAADCDRFLHEYMERKVIASIQEESFLLGYYAHLITDAEFQRLIRDESRVKASWERIKSHHELRDKAMGMEETWDSIKVLINGKERMKDIYTIEKDYLDEHPNSGYLTEIIELESFPDYIDYLPQGAIPRKVKVMGYIPQKTASKYPYIGMSLEEYNLFLDRASDMVTDALRLHKWRYLNRAESDQDIRR
ncbi:MAG: zinc dependent phospholipase C family protein [Lachnospiraceae bacterium]|nr:zinc dependent phospholipase C family protein [Lachnospiraceae bacterium]